MEVNEKAYTLVLSKEYRWEPLEVQIKAKAYDITSPGKFLYQIKTPSKKCYSVPDKYLYPTRQMAQDIADHLNEDLVS